MPLGKALFLSYIDQEWRHLACKTVCSLVFLCKCAAWREHAARQVGIRFYENMPLVLLGIPRPIAGRRSQQLVRSSGIGD